MFLRQQQQAASFNNGSINAVSTITTDGDMNNSNNNMKNTTYNETKKKLTSKSKNDTSSRLHLIVFAGFCATFVCYTERVGFSIAFTRLAVDAGIDESKKGAVLSAFFYGYATTQIPGGWAAARWGGKLMLLISFTLWPTICVIMFLISDNMTLLSFCRVLIGASQGLFIPALHTVLANWIPPIKRSRYVSFATSGMYLGSAISSAWIPPFVSKFSPSMEFLAVAFLGFIWLTMWIIIGEDYPILPSLSNKKKETIDMEGGGSSIENKISTTTPSSSSSSSSNNKVVPWKALILSTPSWAILTGNFSFHYCLYTIMNWLPTYFEQYLHIELLNMGLLKMIPWLMIFLFSNIAGFAGDYLIVNHQFSVSKARKCINSVGFIGTAISVNFMAVFASGMWSGVFYVSMCFACLGITRGGWAVNHLDIAPKYAGVLMSLSNGMGTISGVIGVALTGNILDLYGGSHEPLGWLYAFEVMAFLCLGNMIYFNIFAKGENCFH